MSEHAPSSPEKDTPAPLWISDDDLRGLVDDCLRAQRQVIAPMLEKGAARARPLYAPLATAEALRLQVDDPLPSQSLRRHFQPPSQALFRWTFEKPAPTEDQPPENPLGKVALQPATPAFPPTVILGARPCDAAALEIVDQVMREDRRDESWFSRRAATVILTRGCTWSDASCFCTSLGLGPDAPQGSDLLLLPAQGGHVVRVLTAKGQAFVADHAPRFAAPLPDHRRREAEAALAALRQDLENKPLSDAVDHLRQGLGGAFSAAIWDEVALRCHGCGVCAALCPTCYCFDIVEEPHGPKEGVRRMKWDTCQDPIFTLHGSGHNPRPNQSSRYRQRVLHKFSVYPNRFGQVLCTGCGRCVRACPAGMDLAEILLQVDGALDHAAKKS